MANSFNTYTQISNSILICPSIPKVYQEELKTSILFALLFENTSRNVVEEYGITYPWVDQLPG